MNRREARTVILAVMVLLVLRYAISVPAVRASSPPPPPPPPPPDFPINEENIDQWRADWLAGKLTPEEEQMFKDYVDEHVGDDLQGLPPQYLEESEIPGITLR